MMFRYVWILSGALWLIAGTGAYASEMEDSLDYKEIQEAMDEMLPESVHISFSELVSQLADGNIREELDRLKSYIADQLFYEIKNSRGILLQMVGIIFVSAVFTNFSMAFSKTFIAETGFYLT